MRAAWAEDIVPTMRALVRLPAQSSSRIPFPHRFVSVNSEASRMLECPDVIRFYVRSGLFKMRLASRQEVHFPDRACAAEPPSATRRVGSVIEHDIIRSWRVTQASHEDPRPFQLRFLVFSRNPDRLIPRSARRRGVSWHRPTGSSLRHFTSERFSDRVVYFSPGRDYANLGFERSRV